MLPNHNKRVCVPILSQLLLAILISKCLLATYLIAEAMCVYQPLLVNYPCILALVSYICITRLIVMCMRVSEA